MSINKAIILGNVGKEPEIRQVGGATVVNLTIATTDKGYTKQDGTVIPDRTEWHNVVMWNKLAEIAVKYVRKGMKLYIEGKIRTRKYEKDGQTKYVTEVFADTMEMCSNGQPAAAPAAAPTPAPAAHYNPMQQMMSFPDARPTAADITEVGPNDDLPF